jgi:hypothetical protein
MTSLLRQHRFKLLVPLAAAPLLALWTAIVWPFSYYGHWAVYPALLVLPVVALIHAYFVWALRPKWPLIAFGVGHLLFVAGVWLICLMLISHDSL